MIKLFRTLSTLVFTLIASSVLSGCSKKTIWIYTSFPKEMISEMDPLLRAAVPKADIKWLQGGNDQVAEQVTKELTSEKDVIADVLLTSDPYWYLDLKKQNKLLPYQSPAAKDLPTAYRDPEDAFSTVRISTMVMGYDSSALKPADLPQRWKDLLHSKWDGKISIGSPLESSSIYTAVGILSKLYGWDFFAQLRKLDIMATGGNNSTFTRIETNERPVGILLLENILKAHTKKSVVRPIYPLDGVIPIPGSIALLRTTKHPEVAKKVYDWFYSSPAQNIIARGGMYSPLPKMISPENARPWAELQIQLIQWSPQLLESLYNERAQIRAKFSEVVLH